MLESLFNKVDDLKAYLKEYLLFLFLSFLFNCYLDDPSLRHCRRGSLANPMLITEHILVPPEDHLKPRNEVGSLSTAERPVIFEPGPPFRLCI